MPKKKATGSTSAATQSKAVSQKKPAKKTAKPKKPPKPRPSADDPDKPLTGKQKAFVAWYVSEICNFNGVEAARRAGYTGTYNTLRAMASENLAKPNIRKAVDEATKKALDGADVTVEGTLRDLRQVYLMAIEAGQYSAAKGAAELRGKYLKMFTDRIEHVETIDEVSTEDLVDLAREIAEANKIDLGQLLKGNEPDNGHAPDTSGDQTTH